MKGIHHLHVRKRVHQNLEPFPARTPLKRLIDLMVYVVGVLGPFMTIPQVFAIYSTKDVSGISIFSWGAYALFDIPWIIYGLVHKDRPIVITYVLWFIFNMMVVVGTFIYQ